MEDGRLVEALILPPGLLPCVTSAHARSLSHRTRELNLIVGSRRPVREINVAAPPIPDVLLGTSRDHAVQYNVL